MTGLNVLIADDEPGIRELIRDALSSLGHDVTCARCGMEAISVVSESNVDVVFLDIQMPNGDGLTALREIQSMRPSLPVVMITGCGDQDLVSESLSSGSSMVLMKPFSIRDIIGAMEIAQLTSRAA